MSIISFSCEDTKSKKTKAEKEATSEKSKLQKKRDSMLNNLKIPSDGSETDIDLKSIKTLDQKELIPFLTEYGKENPETHIRISTSYGNIDVRLFKDTPLHRANFIRLTKIGYFNSTVFHRVSKDFVDQGGNSDEKATSKIRKAVGHYLIPSEFKSDHAHKRGAFSMAKYSEQNVSNASSPFEFFIVASSNGAHHLDNEHTVFGEVTKGMEVVDSINNVEVDLSEWPLIDIPMTIEVMD